MSRPIYDSRDDEVGRVPVRTLTSYTKADCKLGRVPMKNLPSYTEADYVRKKPLRPAIPQGRRCENIEVGFPNDRLKHKMRAKEKEKVASWEDIHTKSSGKGMLLHKEKTSHTGIADAVRKLAKSKWHG